MLDDRPGVPRSSDPESGSPAWHDGAVDAGAVAPDNGLTVAVTGPTGDLGKALLRELQRTPEVRRVIGLARRPFNPSAHELKKVEYRRGDVLDRASVDALVQDADVVVHLAFMIFGRPDDAHQVNIEGSRNVFESAVGAGVARIIYASSVAAYGFHDDNPDVLTEDVPARGTDSHYYSAQKAQVEKLLANVTRGQGIDVYVFRPCIVAGPTALSLIEKIPYVQLGEKLPSSVKKLAGAIPLLRPVVPDPGTPFQLVHEEDVARALVLGVLGKGEPGAYNLAGEGSITTSDIAHALGWYSIPVTELAMDATAKVVSRLPLMPVETKWLKALRVPVLMDCTKARQKLGWEPQHDVLETLSHTIYAAREKGLLSWRLVAPQKADL